MRKAFIWGVLVTWNYDLFPSFLLFSIGWIMLACNEMVRRHPSRWHNAPSFYELLQRVATNKVSPERVTKHPNPELIAAYEEKLEKRRLQLAAEKQKVAKQEEILQLELGAEMQKAEKAEQLHGGGGLGNVVENPLKPILYPIQKQLADVVCYLRIAKSIALWNESYYSFWIVAASFASSLAICSIPWAFIMRWLLRIVVVIGLGPWMKLLDKTNPDMTDEERDAVLRQRLTARYDEVLRSASNFFIRKERAMKLKAMAKYMFGKFMLRVPRFKEDLFPDYPLHTSTAIPVENQSMNDTRIDQRKYGQNLQGDMIPMREIQVSAQNAQGKHEKRRKVLRFWKKPRQASESTPLLSSK
jgi:hypothetical protein